MNTQLRQKAKNNFEKDFYKLINDPVFRKKLWKMWGNRNNKLVTTECRRNYLISEPSYPKYIGTRNEKNLY